jgi:hypothetical protein
VATEHRRAEDQLAALSARYVLPASASSKGEKPSTKVELIVILSTADARFDRADGVIERHQATRRRLPRPRLSAVTQSRCRRGRENEPAGRVQEGLEVAAAVENGFIE